MTISLFPHRRFEPARGLSPAPLFPRNALRRLRRLCPALCLWGALALALAPAALRADEPPDTDGDAMSDAYEAFFGLDPFNPADAALDNDGDLLTNSVEAVAGTDPFAPDTDRDGWTDFSDWYPLSRAFLQWGAPRFTEGETYWYPGPAWWLGAAKEGGQWLSNPPAFHVAADDTNAAALLIFLDRGALTTDVRLATAFFDHPGGQLYVDLLDSNTVNVATNLFGNFMTGANIATQNLVNVPLGVHPDAVAIQLRRAAGEVTVYTNRVYVDEDGDGLDADQEGQLGTSDLLVDSDADGLPDVWEWAYFGDFSRTGAGDEDADCLSNAEELAYGTDPTLADSDGDGMGDAAEVLRQSDPAVWESHNLLPFEERFETNTVSAGLIDGQNGWHAAPSNAGIVQTGTVYEGEQALSIQGTNADTRVEMGLGAAGKNIVWVDLRIVCRGATAPPGTPASAAAVFFNTAGRLVVYDGTRAAGQEWITLSNHPPVAQGDWARWTLKLDYGQQRYLVCLNGLLVADGLGFATPRCELSGLQFRGKDDFVDHIVVGTNTPPDLSQDGDLLPDLWELEHFGNLDQNDSGDPDGDGLTNLQEYSLGSDPTRTDTDGDGIGDAVEVFYGVDPAVSNRFGVLPFIEDFETNTVVTGDLNGQNDWMASPPDTVLVQTSTVYEGAQALQLNAGPQEISEAKRLFSAGAPALAWLDIYMKVVPGMAPTNLACTSAALYFDGNGHLVVYDRLQPGTNQWVTLAAAAPTGNWARITLKLDYASKTWFVCLNGADAARDLGFATTNVAAFTGFTARGRQGFADALSVTTNAPPDLTVDWDNLPNDWEQFYFGNLDQTDAGDPDGDGLTNLQEYLLGSNPTVNDTALDSDGDGLSNYEEYALYGTNPFLADSDGDGVNDMTEIGNGTNPLAADQGSSPDGPVLTVLSPEEGEFILW